MAAPKRPRGRKTRPNRPPATGICSTTVPTRPAAGSRRWPRSSIRSHARGWRPSASGRAGAAGRSGRAGRRCRRGSAERAGPSGYVLATDIDVEWVEAEAGFAVRGATPRRRRGRSSRRRVRSRARAARAQPCARARHGARAHGCRPAPGGWLLVEDFDVALQPLACIDEQNDADALANRIRRGFLELLAARGADLSYGRSLPRRLGQARSRGRRRRRLLPGGARRREGSRAGERAPGAGPAARKEAGDGRRGRPPSRQRPRRPGRHRHSAARLRLGAATLNAWRLWPRSTMS